jgi:hypothetical protein
VSSAEGVWKLLMAALLALASFAVGSWIWLHEPWLPACAAGRFGDLGTCLGGPIPAALPGWQLFLVVAAGVALAWTIMVALGAIRNRQVQPAHYLAGLTLIAVTTLAAFELAWPANVLR